MKVLLSAFACAPDIGSEPEVGLQAMLCAAHRHEVWVLTQRHMAEAVRGFLQGHRAAPRIHLVVVDPPAAPPRGGVRELVTAQWGYDRWQRRAAVAAAELDRRVDFDLVHHVTLAAYWMRAGVAAVGKPLVWGPVGGGVETPWRLLRELGARGLAEDAVRTAARRMAGWVPALRLPQETAAVIFAQNPATGRRIHSRVYTAVLPNALHVDVGPIEARGPRTRDIAMVGRLLPWKGTRLAVRTMRYVTQDGVVLRLYGDGPERRRILDAMRRWGVEDRIVLEGPTPRQQVLKRLARAAALLHPSFHEEGGTAVAEALAIGTPVICLRRGGPEELIGQWPTTSSVAVEPGWPEATARALAAAIDRFVTDPPDVLASARKPEDSFQERLLEAYDRAVELGGHRSRRRRSSRAWSGERVDEVGGRR
jgi:glycosyltransferase involved in cell wall biosynthesis